MRSRKATIGMVIVGLALLLLVGYTGGGGTSKYAVSGTVTGVGGDGIKGVALSFEGFGTADTDEDGQWRKDGLSGAVKVAPTKNGWAFDPSSRTVSKADSSVNFVATMLEYPLTIQVQGEGTVNQEVLVAAQGTEYEHGTQVQLTAVPATGWRFSHWEGDLEGSSALVVVAMDSTKNVTAVFTEQDDRDYMGLELGATWVYEETRRKQDSDGVDEYKYTGEVVIRVVAVQKVGDQSFYTIEGTHQGKWDNDIEDDYSYEYQWLKDSHDRYYDIDQTWLQLLLEAPLEIGSTLIGLSVVRQEKRMTPLGELDAWVAEERYDLEEGEWQEVRFEVVPYLGLIYQGHRVVWDGGDLQTSIELISYSINGI